MDTPTKIKVPTWKNYVRTWGTEIEEPRCKLIPNQRAPRQGKSSKGFSPGGVAGKGMTSVVSKGVEGNAALAAEISLGALCDPAGKLFYNVLLNNGIAIPSVAAAKMERNNMSGQTAASVVSFSSRHLNPSTAYVNGSTFAIARSHGGNACMG